MRETPDGRRISTIRAAPSRRSPHSDRQPWRPPKTASAASPHTSFVLFQSGTTPSGHRRAPMTGAFTASSALYRSVRDQISTGSVTSCVVVVGEAEAQLDRERHGAVPAQRDLGVVLPFLLPHRHVVDARCRARPCNRRTSASTSRGPAPTRSRPCGRSRRRAGCLNAQRRDVLAEGAVEGLLAHDVVAQREQHRAGLPVADRAERARVDAIGRRHERRCRIRLSTARLPVGRRRRDTRWCRDSGARCANALM